MSFRSSSSVSITGSTAYTGTKPTGSVAGDRLIAFLSWDASGAVATAPAGWTHLLSAITNAPDSQSYGLFEYRSSPGSESYAFTVPGAASGIIQVYAFTGRDSAFSAVLACSANESAAGVASPFSTTNGAVELEQGDDVLVLTALDQTVQTDTWSFTGPGGYTERQDVANSDWTTMSGYTLDNATAGSSGSLATTATRSAGTGNADYVSVVLRLRPAGSVTGRAQIFVSSHLMAAFAVTTLTHGPTDTTASGSTFIIICPSGSLSTVTDNKGNTYTRIAQQALTNSTLEVWSCVNGVGGAGHTWTTTYSTSASRSVSVHELRTAGAYDSASKVTGTDSTSPYSVTSNTLANPESIAFLMMEGDTNNGKHDFTAPSGWMTHARQSGTATSSVGVMSVLTAVKSVVGTAALSPSVTGLTSLQTGLAIFAFNDPVPVVGVSYSPMYSNEYF